jgi:hypothetical protein
VNPEYVSQVLEDTIPPTVQDILAVRADGRATSFGDGRFTFVPKKFVVAVLDKRDAGPYENPPTTALLWFQSGAVTGWDFSKFLANADGSFPGLWNFFLPSIRTIEGREYETSGGYGTGLSLVQLPVPAGAQGPFVIEVRDAAGNAQRSRGSITAASPPASRL